MDIAMRCPDPLPQSDLLLQLRKVLGTHSPCPDIPVSALWKGAASLTATPPGSGLTADSSVGGGNAPPLLVQPDISVWSSPLQSSLNHDPCPSPILPPSLPPLAQVLNLQDEQTPAGSAPRHTASAEASPSRGFCRGSEVQNPPPAPVPS